MVFTVFFAVFEVELFSYWTMRGVDGGQYLDIVMQETETQS